MVNFSLYRSVVLIGIVQMTSCRPQSPCPSKHYRQWLRCCRWASFNTWAEPFHRKGNSSCWKIAGFESWQHVCCASLQRAASMLKLKWQGNFTNYPVKTLHQRHHGHFLFNKTKDLFFYSHHKTGCMLVDSLLHEFAIFLNMKDFTKSNIQGVEHVGYICKSFLLKTNQERSEARRILKPRMISTLETAKLRFMAHFDRAPFAPVSTALTLKVHVVRPPSHLVVSGYLYHLKGLETWLIRQQPPDCLSCDYFAWVKIFEPCNFRCSYLEVLRSVNNTMGLLLEAYRSRWQILEMIQTVHVWHDDPTALQLHLDDFRAETFHGSVLCILRFVLQRPGPLPIDPTPLLQAAAKHSPQRLRKFCASAEAGCSWRELQSARHMASESARKNLRRTLGQIDDDWVRQLRNADRLFKKLMTQSISPMTFGCPVS